MTKLGAVCDHILEAGWLAALVTVPLYFNIYSSRVFEPDKLVVLRSIVLMMCVAYLVKTFEHRDPRSESASTERVDLTSLIRKWSTVNPLALPSIALACVYVIATAVSVSPIVSLWGSYQRLQGTYTFFSYVVLFFIIAHNLRTKAQVDRLVTVVLLTSLPASLYGIAQNHHLDPLPWGGDVTIRVASTMGNAIFIAAYLIMIVPLTLARLVEVVWRWRNWKGPLSADGLGQVIGLSGLLVLLNLILTAFVVASMKGQNLWWGALPLVAIFIVTSLAFGRLRRSYFVLLSEGAGYGLLLLIQLYTIFLSQSRGPWIGLGVGMVVFAILLSVRWGSRRMLMASSGIMLLLAAFVITFNIPNSPLTPWKSVPYIGRMGQLLETEDGTGKVRVLIWEGALKLIATHPSIGFSEDPLNVVRPLIGYGPEAMYVAYNKVYPPDLAHYEARNASPDRSHMDTLDYLVTTGVLGLVAFFAVLFVGLKTGWQVLRRTKNVAYQVLLVGIISSVVAHFVETQVGIAIASTLTYMWAFFGLVIAVRHIDSRKETVEPEQQAAASAVARTGVPSAVSAKVATRERPKQAKKGKTAKSGALANSPARPPLSAGNTNWPLAALYAFTTIVGLIILSTWTGNLDIWLAFILGFFWFAIGILAAAFGLGALPNGVTWRQQNWWVYLVSVVAAVVAIVLNLNVVAADVYYKRGFALDSQRQWSQAIPAYQEALKLAPGQDFYYLFMGRAFLELAKASQKPRLGQSFVANAELVRHISGQELNRLGREDLLELSRAALEEALALNPLNTDHHANLARLYRFWGEGADRQKMDLSIKYYAQATTLSPQAAHIWDEWAEVYLAKGMPNEALEKAQRGAEIDPIYPPSYVYLGDAYLALGKLQEALAAHTRAVELDPASLSDFRLESRVTAYLNAGLVDGLSSAFAKAAQSDRGRNSPQVHSALGYILSRQGKIKEATSEFRLWVQLAPNDWVAHRNLAIAYDAQGMIDDAIREASEAARFAPPDQQQQLQTWIAEVQKRKR